MNNYTVAGNVITSGVNDTNINANANFTISSGGNLSNPATTSNIIGGVTLCNSTLGVNCNAPAYTLDVLGSAAYTPASLSATARLTTPAVVWSNSNIPLGTFASNTSLQLAGLQLAYNGSVYGGDIAGGIQQNVGGVLSLGTTSGAAAVNNYENMRMTNCNTWFPARGGVQITGDSGLQLQVPGSIFCPGAAASGSGFVSSLSNSNVATAFGASNFTIELWAFPTYTSTYADLPIFSTGITATSEIRIAQSITASNTPGFRIGTTAVQGTAGAIVSNTWYHVALVRNANVFTMYINGVSNAGATIAGFTFSNAAAILLGAYGGAPQYYTGFIGNVRITNGLAVYTAPFTPPVGALPFIPGTSLLMNMFTSNTALTDSVNNTPFGLYNGAAWSMYSPGYAAGAGNAIATLGAVGTIQQVAYYPNANTGIPTRRLDIRPTADYTIIESTGEMQVNSTNGGLYLKSFNYGVNLVGSNSAFTFSNSATSTNVFNVASNGALSNSNVTSNTIGGVTLSNGILAVTSGATAMPATMTATQNIVSGFSTTVLGSVTGTATSNVVDDATIYSFTAGTGTFAVAAGAPVIVDYLIVGGGGSGGNGAGGGGGAGGVVYMKGVQLPAGSYAWTVGGGGASQATNNTSGTAGSNSTLSNSTFGNMVALGGGAGGGYTTSPAGGAGASGGGAAGGATVGGNAGGSSATGQGFVGGTATSNGSFGGGGGGAGGSGIAGAGSGGTGGLGLVIPITGSNVYYAGGGGASTNVGSGTSPAGGLGGGGAGTNGALNVAGTSGLANSGGGGGASGNGGASGAGGSGVIIIRVYTNTSSRMLIGDGGGYSMALSAQSNGITTDVMTVTDKGNVSIGLSNALFSGPLDNKFDSLGNMYIADYTNHRVRKISPTGRVTTFLGNGLPAVTAGTGTGASINLPLGLAIGVMGGVETLFVASAQHVVVAVPIATGVMTIIAGAHGLPGNTDSTTGTTARFNTPNALALDTTNSYIFVADINNNAIRRIAYTGTYAVTTLGSAGFVASATPVTITGTPVRGLVFDGTSTLYYCSTTAYGKVTTAGVNTSNASGFTYASGITFNSNKTGVYFVDWGVHQVFSAGLGVAAAVAIAGTSGVAGSLDATGLNATLNGPRSLTLDPTGSNLYIAEYGNNKIRKFNIATSNVTTYVGTGTAGFADGSVPTATTVNNTLLVSSNIGINNNTPTYPLDVQGTLRCYSATNNVMGLMSPAYGSYIHIGAWDQTGATSKNLVLNQYGGKVGIGCNAPQWELDVNGIVQIRSTVYGAGTTGYALYTVGTTFQINPRNTDGSYASVDGLTIQSNGNVGIGTSAPSYRLDVNGTSRFSGNVSLPAYSVTATILAGAASPNATYVQWGDGSGWKFAFQGNSARTSNVLTLVDSGNVGIGCNAPAYTLDVAGPIRAAPAGLTQPGMIISGVSTDNGLGKNVATLRLSNTTSSTSWNFYGPDSGNTLGILNGSAVGMQLTNGATSWTSTSDSRLKTVIAPITNATAAFETITPVYYTLNVDTSNVRRIGVIAQEILPHFPEIISEDTDGFYGVRYTELVSPLITAVKELSARLSNVEARLAAATTP